MNKCSCVYVAAVKLTLSDLAYECLFDNSYSLCPNKRKYQEDDGMNFTRAPNSTPTTQLFLVTKINLQRKSIQSSSLILLKRVEFTLCWTLDKSHCFDNFGF